MAPSKMKAVLVKDKTTVEVGEYDTPEPKGKEVRLRNLVLGQNPTDWKHAGLVDAGSLVGADSCGVVDALGPDVPKDAVKLGERRAGFVRAVRNGAHAEYVVHEYDVCWRVPDNVTSEEAATTPIAFFTAVQLLFIRLEIAEPPADGSAAQSSGRWIYIHSGATAVGHFAIQLAKLSGLKVASSSSPHNFDLLKKLGADVVVNYRDKDFAEQVKKATDDSVELGIDCITDGTLEQAVTVFAPKGGKIATILPSEDKLPRDDVEVRKTLVYTMKAGKDQKLGPAEFKAHPKDRETLVDWCQRLTKLSEAGKIQFPRTEDLGGFEKVNEGYARMRDGKVSGCKLVYTVGQA